MKGSGRRREGWMEKTEGRSLGRVYSAARNQEGDGERGIAEGEKLRSRRWKDADEEGAEFERKDPLPGVAGRYEREFSVLQLRRARSASILFFSLETQEGAPRPRSFVTEK